MAEKQKKKNKSYIDEGFKHFYAPQRTWELVDKLAKATGETKMKIIEEGAMLYAESKVNDNPTYRKGKELIAEVDNNQKEVIKVLKQLLSRQVEHTDAIRSLYSDLENLRKEVSKNGKK